MANALNNKTLDTTHNATHNTTNMKETTYGDMVKKEKIGPMLGLSPTDPFEIVSENENLVMIHHRPDADMSRFGNLRGVVVDLEKGNVVSHAYPHANCVVSSSIENRDDKIVFQDVQIPLNSARIKIGFEGTLIHVFKHGGQVYRTTRKRLDPSRSRWGNSKTFGEMYWDLSGPSDETLFNPDKLYSPYCHSFIMVHPDVLICTKDSVGKGYLVYLGPKQMYSTDLDSCPYPLEEVDLDLHVPETSSTLEPGNTIYSPEDLSVEEANKHLLFGFYEGIEGYEYLDPRLLPGEFVIVENQKTGDMYRVESHPYAWRAKMRNNNPNLLHRFFELLDYAYLKNNEDDGKKYVNMFPLLTLYDKESLQSFLKNDPIIVWPQNTETVQTVPSSKDTKLYNIWQVFLTSVPIHRQQEVVGYHDYLTDRRNELTEWLIETSDKSPDLTEFSKRAQDILGKTKSFAKTRFNQKGSSKSILTLTHDNIRNFISKEKGSSLYRLIREMDRFKNPRDVNK